MDQRLLEGRKKPDPAVVREHALGLFIAAFVETGRDSEHDCHSFLSAPP